MKKLIKALSLVAFVAVASSTFAQTSGDDKKAIVTEQINKLDRAVTLTPEQRTTITDMAYEYMDKLDVIKADKATFADNKKILDSRYEIKVKEVLTADQWTKFDTQRKLEQQRK